MYLARNTNTKMILTVFSFTVLCTAATPISRLTCRESAQCDVQSEYCDVTINRCIKCAVLCNPERGMESECNSHCYAYMMILNTPKSTPVDTATTLTSGVTREMTVPSETAGEFSYLIGTTLLSAIGILLLTCLIFGIALIYLGQKLKKKKDQGREEPIHDNKPMSTDNHYTVGPTSSCSQPLLSATRHISASQTGTQSPDDMRDHPENPSEDSSVSTGDSEELPPELTLRSSKPDDAVTQIVSPRKLSDRNSVSRSCEECSQPTASVSQGSKHRHLSDPARSHHRENNSGTCQTNSNPTCGQFSAKSEQTNQDCTDLQSKTTVKPGHDGSPPKTSHLEPSSGHHVQANSTSSPQCDRLESKMDSSIRDEGKVEPQSWVKSGSQRILLELNKRSSRKPESSHSYKPQATTTSNAPVQSNSPNEKPACNDGTAKQSVSHPPANQREEKSVVLNMVEDSSVYPDEPHVPLDKPQPKTYQQNKHIYDLLRKIPWVEGYYSEGQSIQVFVDLLNLKPDWASRQLQEETGQPMDKFHVIHSAQLS